MEGFSKKRRAFTLVEILIDFLVVSLVAVAILSAYVAAMKSITLAKSKMMAIAIANEKMENIRNMAYDDLATLHGAIYPPGSVADDEVIKQNGIEFNIHTIINYVDDPFDGNATGTIADKPKDVYPYDYKKVQINVGINGRKSQLANITTNVSAKAAETPSNTGILNLCVVDSKGVPVPEAEISIKNDQITPNVNISVTTEEAGCALVPKLPPDEHNHYLVSITKDGFSYDQTYPRTAQNPNALKPNLNVIIQQVTSMTFVIDYLSKIDLSFVNQAGNPVPGINFTLTGSDLIYNNPDTPRYSANLTADGNGHILVNDLKFDSYSLSILTSGYYIVSTVPTSNIDLPSGTTLPVKAILSASSTNPAILGVMPATGVAPDNATVTIKGRNLANSSTVILKNRANGSEIVGANVSAHGQIQLECDFNLAGAAIGDYDIIIRNTNGESVTQEFGFKVVTGS